jgi:hypothetical protein
VTRGRDETSSLLRWYPRAWRERYGEELQALMEDGLGDGAPTAMFKVSMVRAGLREHAHCLLGAHGSPPERARTGSLLVLCSWTAFVLAGASFSKVSEHFARAMPFASRAISQDAFNVVAALGIVGVGLVMLGAIAALPACGRFVRGGGWSSIRGHVIRSTLLAAMAVGAAIPLSVWAHHLNEIQRNGGDGIYSGAIGLWALLVTATLAQWTVTGVATARRIDWARRTLRIEAVLAVAVAGVMATMTVATALWWGTVAQDAPWFLHGTASGTHPSPFTLQLVVTMMLMLISVLVAVYGTVEVGRSWTGLRVD